jgi:SAM-dependent methyltransferase
MPEKPFAPACERNKDAILAVLRECFADRAHVLEIGSGTGQHAVHFAAGLPHLRWQASDMAANLDGIRMWLEEARLPNTPPPIELDVNGDWPAQTFDAVFCSNTVHIIGWDEVIQMFTGIGRVLEHGGLLVLYGPFNYGGRYTSESNAAFDDWLKARDPNSAIRDFDAIRVLAADIGCFRVADHAMPANNRTLVFARAMPC